VGHVFARLVGYGMVLVPHWPYLFERHADGGDVVRVTRWVDDAHEHALIAPDRPVEPSTTVDVENGPDHRYWLIETSVCRLAWPAGFTLESPHDADDSTPFYLHGAGGATIFPQGPALKAQLAGPDALVGPGQRVLDRRTEAGAAVVEVSYEHDGEPWWQGHWTVPYGSDRLLVITAQAPAEHAAPTRAAAETVVSSIR
jgi:hypothetical protein